MDGGQLMRETPRTLGRTDAGWIVSEFDVRDGVVLGAVPLAFGVVVSSIAALVFVPALWLVLHRVGTGTQRTAMGLGDIVGRAPRVAQWLARYPFLQDSLRSQEFTDLVTEDEEGLDPETARIARTGLAPLYYRREFDRQAMGEQLSAIAEKAPSTDEPRNWLGHSPQPGNAARRKSTRGSRAASFAT